MLAFQRKSSLEKCRTNVLPCRIHHDGPTKVTKRYWSPKDEKDGIQSAHFRGRRLRGRAVNLPVGYEGVVAKSTNRTIPMPTKKAGPSYTAIDSDLAIAEEEEEEPEPVKIIEAVSAFEEIVVWGHDRLPTSDDPFIKGIAEWISFAEAIHGGSEPPSLTDAAEAGDGLSRRKTPD